MITSLPLRYGVWLVCLVIVVMVWLQVRVEVNQLRTDLDRSGVAIREARVLNHRLSLERDARRRLVEVERAADELGLVEVDILEAR